MEKRLSRPGTPSTRSCVFRFGADEVLDVCNLSKSEPFDALEITSRRDPAGPGLSPPVVAEWGSERAVSQPSNKGVKRPADIQNVLEICTKLKVAKRITQVERSSTKETSESHVFSDTVPVSDTAPSSFDAASVLFNQLEVMREAALKAFHGKKKNKKEKNISGEMEPLKDIAIATVEEAAGNVFTGRDGSLTGTSISESCELQQHQRIHVNTVCENIEQDVQIMRKKKRVRLRKQKDDPMRDITLSGTDVHRGKKPAGKVGEAEKEEGELSEDETERRAQSAEALRQAALKAVSLRKKNPLGLDSAGKSKNGTSLLESVGKFNYISLKTAFSFIVQRKKKVS